MGQCWDCDLEAGTVCDKCKEAYKVLIEPQSRFSRLPYSQMTKNQKKRYRRKQRQR